MPEDLKPGRVIVTYGRSLMALVIARSLARRGIEVIGCDDVAMTVLTFSKHVKENFTVSPWETRPADFLDDLEEAVRIHAPTDGRPYVLMPVFREVDLIARHRSRFEPLIQIAAPSYESIDLVNPKDHLSLLAEARHLAAPRSYTPHDTGDLSKIPFKLPVVVKPIDGVGGRGVTLATTIAEVAEQVAALGLKPAPLIQEYVEGFDYCVGVLAKGGAVQAMMAYKNLSTFPRNAGAGAIRETVDDIPFRAPIEKLIAAANWDGVCEIDVRWTGNPEDQPKIIEVNARYWAGIFHSIETGVDFPWLLYNQTIGQPIEEPKPRIGAVTKTSAIWLLATLEEVTASDPHLNAAADAWRRARENLATGKLVRAMEDAVHALGATASAREAVDAIATAVARTRGAPSELSSDKDPLVALGALFILSHLLRHHRLPPEVTYRAELAAAPAKPRRRGRPRIGITKPVHGDVWSWWAMKAAVWLAGGTPVKVTAAAPHSPYTIDGVIFGGGSDVYPVEYNQAPTPGYQYDVARGDMELSWASTARRHNLPVLGVCRGAQMLNVFAGGTLDRDLSRYQQPVSATGLIQPVFLRKTVSVNPGSVLASVLGRTKLLVNAIHKQAIGAVGAGLHVVAREPNGIIQAVEDWSRTFWIGVQFHPELLLYRRPYRALFRKLIQVARARAEERLREGDLTVSSVGDRKQVGPTLHSGRRESDLL